MLLAQAGVVYFKRKTLKESSTSQILQEVGNMYQEMVVTSVVVMSF